MAIHDRAHVFCDFSLGTGSGGNTISSMSDPDASRRDQLRAVLPFVAIVAIVTIWLAPITLLGKMPIGGDVTSFFLPLMSYYRGALVDGRVPLWNELWGFGFPMLAESQAGVFYPLHLVLYRLFDVEAAYSINLVVHHVLAGWFAYYCGRSFGLRRWGATLAALVFAGNGFFIIHFPHQWSYTTGCWMPLAVALAWRAVGTEERGWRIEDRGSRTETQPTKPAWRQRSLAGLGLAAVLAVQMLAGHFQIAFYTQVTVLLIGAWCSLKAIAGRLRRARQAASAASIPPARSSILHPRSSILWIGVPVAAAFVLAALQILPTYELIRIALPEGRDFEYLSGFANTPFHLLSYVLPTLFHVNPLWRPVAWDPFHTSPEECFSYVGLLPLCLAVGAAWRWRRDPRVRLWVFVTAATLVLSFGPYQPLFRGLIRLPGFDGFRSTARWGVATALFLGLLAGLGLDRVRAVERLRAWLRRLVAVTLLVGVLVVAIVGVWVEGTAARPRWLWTRSAAEGIDRLWSTVNPWGDRGLGSANPHQPNVEGRTISALARIGYRVRATPGEPTVTWPGWPPYRLFNLAGELKRVFVQELTPPVVMLGILAAAVYFFPWSRTAPRWLLAALAAIDLGAAAWLRPTEFAPRGRIVQDSPVLRHLAEHARGQRISDQNQNLALIAGAAAQGSYRTVDIPFLWLAHMPIPVGDRHQWQRHINDRTDTRWELWPGELATVQRQHPPQPGDRDAEFHDPLLARIGDGAAYAEAFPDFATRFVVRRRDATNASRAWFWDAQHDAQHIETLLNAQLTRARRPTDLTNSWLVLAPLAPVATTRSEPESKEFQLDSAGPGWLVVADLAYPGWQARGVRPDGSVVPAAAIHTGASCVVVQVPQPGRQRVELTYRSRSFELGWKISLAALGLWCATLAVVWRTRRAVLDANKTVP